MASADKKIIERIDSLERYVEIMEMQFAEYRRVNNLKNKKLKKRTKVKDNEDIESFGEFCIRTGHKPHGAQGIDGSKYGYTRDGHVIKLEKPNAGASMN